MTRRSYTPELRRRAVDLYREHGGAEASRILATEGYEVSASLIRSWASSLGVSTERLENLPVHTAAAAATMSARRLALASGLMDDVEKLRTQIFAPTTAHTFDKDGQFRTGQLNEPTFRDKQAILTCIAIAVDKVQLLTGEATARHEHLGSTNPEEIHARAAQLDELAERRRAGRAA